MLNEKRELVGCVPDAYCLKCKGWRHIHSLRAITLKSGKPAWVGLCVDCGVKIYKIDSSSLRDIQRANARWQ